MTEEYIGSVQPNPKFKRNYIEINALFAWLGLVENSVTIAILFQWFVDRQHWQSTSQGVDRDWIQISYSDIVEEIGHGLTLKSTRYRINLLEDAGLLKSETLFNNSKRYQVNFEVFDQLMTDFFASPPYPLYTAGTKNSIYPSAPRGRAMTVEADPLPVEAVLPCSEKERDNIEINMPPSADSKPSVSSSSIGKSYAVPKPAKVVKKKQTFSSFSNKPKKVSSFDNLKGDLKSVRDEDKNLDQFCFLIESLLKDAGSSLKRLREETAIQLGQPFKQSLYAVSTTGKIYTDYPTLLADHGDDIKVNGIESFKTLLGVWLNDEIFEPAQDEGKFVSQTDVIPALFSYSTMRALQEQFNPDGLLDGQTPKPKVTSSYSNPLIEAMEKMKSEQQRDD